MSDLECPYCGAEVELTYDDGHGIAEDEVHKHECPECEKRFVFTTQISLMHSASKADCLNDGNHDWEPTITFPVEATKMRCRQCDTRRKPTNEEWQPIQEKADRLWAQWAESKGATT